MKSKPIYDPKTIEPKWQKWWAENKVYQPDLKAAKKPFYNLMMFPYPSAEGLHVGNMYAFTGADVYGRFQRMQGHDVFEPIGLDGFGIHSENYAIKVGRHPSEHAKVSEKHFYQQLHMIGNGFAWDQKLETYDPDYYRWTQWIFVQMYKHGLAYRKKAMVNWCPSCKTVLSDEQVEGGVCERCKTPTERKETEQWFFKITEYAERLLNNIPKLKWPKKITVAQQNWIGKSKGVEMNFEAVNEKGDKVGVVNVFTTAHDTIFGATFMVISPEHEILSKLISDGQREEVSSYILQSLKKTEQQRRKEEKQKTGVFTGGYVLHPFTKDKMPVWVADYVLMEYGTGAVMGVPGHDARDHEFAKKFKLGIKTVVRPKTEDRSIHIESDGFWDYEVIKNKYSEESELFDSDFLNGLTSGRAKKKIETVIFEKKIGRVVSKYHLRDWLISRQRYWGPPIPMIFCQKCGWQAMPEEDLPVMLPEVRDFQPKGEGKTPLEKAPKEWREVKCPNCGKMAERSTEVSDTFLDSSWYFLAYPNLKTKEFSSSSLRGAQRRGNPVEILRSAQDDNISPFNPELTKRWLPVDVYIGGAEHAVLHLLYSRFVWMALSDWGYLPKELGDEPFPFLFSHGLLIKDGAKMSKSRGNVVNPDEYIGRFGADALRMYLMFLGPYDQGGDFRDTGMAGMYRFLERIWNSFQKQQTTNNKQQTTTELKRLLHWTIKRVTKDIANFKYNTAIAALMEFMNGWEGKGQNQKSKIKDQKSNSQTLSKDDAISFLKLMAPIVPHLAEELYHSLVPDIKNSIHREKWPIFDEKLAAAETARIAVQVNGKTRAVIEIEAEKAGDRNFVEETARGNSAVKRHLASKMEKQVIFVSGKILNFVV